MDSASTVERVFVAPDGEAAIEEKAAVEAVAERGIRGDRYFDEIETGTFVTWDSDEERPSGFDLTLIEQEAIAAIEDEAGVTLAPGEHRRNIETRNTPLNHLVGERFRIGDVVCQGVRLAEPCDHLQRITQPGVLQSLTHRGGLRADIIEGGTIRRGDEISLL